MSAISDSTPVAPLADLHRHLDGSLRRRTLEALALARGLTLPGRLGFWPGMGLDMALAQFDITLSVLERPDAVRRVASEICEDAAAEGVTTLEIRFAPQLHGGASIEAIIDAALDGVDGRAGIILCGLYGEPPAVLAALVEAARARPGVVGIDLAGAPRPQHRVRIADYAPVFARARELGLGCTAHAGEGRPPAEIREVIEVLGVQRIGHGTTLLDDPAVVDLVLERGVVIEACLTSNVHTGAIAEVSEHPLRRWLELGVKACICTDNTLLSGVNLPGELNRAMTQAGLDRANIDACMATGHAAAFRR
jgi:adenosine deaminase